MEQQITLSQGTQTIPCWVSESLAGETRRVVLGVHGFGGSSRDAIQEGIAEEMQLFGSAVVRFDFPAHGENPLRELTLHDCVETLLAVGEYARQRYAGVEDLCIFASGFGAYVTLVALPGLLAMPGKVKLVLHTPSVRMDETLLAMLRNTRDTLQAMDRIRLPAPRPFDVTYRFYEELRRNLVLAEQPIPMLVLHSEENAYIRMQDIRHFMQFNEESRLVIIPGTSHQFLEEGAWDMVLDLTRDWFEFEQVLLGDWD